ncbi:hypothetical protein [Sinorhizobium meliloti]|uniref:Uncharacterized protein n=1 Tax=Rhizobium meliloti TaxID=382 RepID=A0A2J0YWV5_RHIML|nr:hypothetical protein [Sinorhizobium meliloti]PJR12762.1 hypothetical protein CEJ86_24535 [Sinorhizobium meliloti]
MNRRSTLSALATSLVLFALPTFAHPVGEMPHGSNGAEADAPGNHGMFMVGTETLFLLHMPMFTQEKHMYEVILRAHLPEDAMAEYRKLRASNPDKAYNLINVDSDQFTLPEIKAGKVTAFKATIYDGYSNEDGGTPGPVLLDNVPVVIDDVVVFRHFNFGIDRPEELVYVLFGYGDEAHLANRIARDPDFQDILTLPGPPPQFSASQIEAGLELNFKSIPSQPLKCSSPLDAMVYDTRFEGREDAPVKMDLTTGMHHIWYSTGNLLNERDPCAPE